MTGVKVDILWSPNHPDRFITFGTDLRLYQLETLKDGCSKSSAIPLSDNSCAALLSINSDNHYMKCIAWYPRHEPDNLLAVGQANGKVVLTSFSQNFESSDLIGQEFVPRQARQCNAVAWSPIDCNLLAAGLDKNRSDYALLIWDVAQPQLSTFESEGLDRRQHIAGFLTGDHTGNQPTSRPLFELGLSETVHSLHWSIQQQKMLFCGMTNKYLKVFDLRDSSKHSTSTPTKAVFGVCVDPFCEHRLASFVENQVVIWDIRNFEKPMNVVTESRHVTKLAWCPTRNGVLTSVVRDSSVVKLYDIQQASLGNDEVEPAIVERCVQPYAQHAISSFSWHPTFENRLLTVTPTGTIRDYTVFDRITLNWSPTSEIVWTHGKKLLQCIDHRDQQYKSLDDISVKMRRRALLGYGLKTRQLWQNGEIAQEPGLLELWTWLDRMKSLREEGKIKGFFKGENKYEGVRSLIFGGDNSQGVWVTSCKSEQIFVSWVGLDSKGQIGSSKVPMYHSNERDRALQLCEWGYDTDGLSLVPLLEKLEIDRQYSRAAAIAIFTLKMKRAIQILKKGATANPPVGKDVNLNVVAMALSGFTQEKNTLWREMCDVLRPQLNDPYLRSMFAFLTSDVDNYDCVLNESGIAVKDRVSFACLYLPDNKLFEYLDRLTTKVIETGDLAGILLTGLNQEGLQLLQRYVDLTGDVQTASLVVLQAIPSFISQDQQAQLWVKSYRDLLDSWRLWHQRALFDVQWCKVNPSTMPPQQVFVSCNFCGKSVTSYFQQLGQFQGMRTYGRFNFPVGNKSKMTSCPGCRKPLPRCALCLTNMGTPAGVYWNKGSEQRLDKVENKLTKFSSWFTWCQTCRHGGHAAHLIEWFKDHAECPVTACSCKCMSLDAVTNVANVTEKYS
ncbi:GATOR complex protein MIOS-like [Limulus polyphemus]|uniref:GATOR complex protein MIOS-like n=1 Tax=Limulus polyphemus TaxID=6850 RepID=A0ABM1B184_LIMPO|nr:GATOR complex protein MIOS-like [Limulus polyphemus]XP_022239546.1 GATOR complex protein MIOS-like [Limulus polyphemus]